MKKEKQIRIEVLEEIANYMTVHREEMWDAHRDRYIMVIEEKELLSKLIAMKDNISEEK